jgi:undecaprenyl-diphosphatase
MTSDLYFFQLVNQFAGKWLWLDNLAVFFARYFEFVLIFFLLLFLVKNFKKYWLIVIQAAAAAILARLIIVEFIRWLWPRTRPFVENSVNLLFNYNPEIPSFPSGHAAFYFAIAAIVYFYNKKIGILFFIAAFLISLARVFAGVHWPSDIIAGALVGIFSGWLIILFFRKFF